MNDQQAQMIINELRNIVTALQVLAREVSDVSSQIRRK